MWEERFYSVLGNSFFISSLSSPATTLATDFVQDFLHIGLDGEMSLDAPSTGNLAAEG